jgi:hypothetical protein
MTLCTEGQGSDALHILTAAPYGFGCTEATPSESKIITSIQYDTITKDHSAGNVTQHSAGAQENLLLLFRAHLLTLMKSGWFTGLLKPGDIETFPHRSSASRCLGVTRAQCPGKKCIGTMEPIPGGTSPHVIVPQGDMDNDLGGDARIGCECEV